MGYYNNYLIDNHSCIIVGVQATGARLSEGRAAQEMISHFTQLQGKSPQSIVADASYGNGELLQWLMDRRIRICPHAMLWLGQGVRCSARSASHTNLKATAISVPQVSN